MPRASIFYLKAGTAASKSLIPGIYGNMVGGQCWEKKTGWFKSKLERIQPEELGNRGSKGMRLTEVEERMWRCSPLPSPTTLITQAPPCEWVQLPRSPDLQLHTHISKPLGGGLLLREA